MISKKHISYLKKLTRTYFPDENEVKIFIFGSALRREKFRDVDIGFLSKLKNGVERKKIIELEGEIQNSTLPFDVDLVDFQNVEEDFRKYVFKNEKILWI